MVYSKHPLKIILEVVAHGIAECFGIAVLNDIDQAPVRYEFLMLHRLLENVTLVDILERRQQHTLKSAQGFVARNVVEFAVEAHFLVYIENCLLGVDRLIGYNGVCRGTWFFR